MPLNMGTTWLCLASGRLVPLNRISALDVWGPARSVGDGQQETPVIPARPSCIMVELDGARWEEAASCEPERGGLLQAELATVCAEASLRQEARFVYGLLTDDRLLIRWTFGRRFPAITRKSAPDGVVGVTPLWRRLGPVPTDSQ